jgi:hypothetical protein
VRSGQGALLLVPNHAAGLWLVSDALRRANGVTARLGWRRRNLEQHCRVLAGPSLLAAGQSFVSGVAAHAVCARVLRELGAAQRLGRFAAVSGQPGFVRALGQTLSELRMAEVSAPALREHDHDLALYLETYEAVLADSQLCDLAGLYAYAIAAARLLQEPQLLALDIPVLHAVEAQLVQALGASSERAWVGVPLGDTQSLDAWRSALGPTAAEHTAQPTAAGELGRLQAQLFAGVERLQDLPAAAGERETQQVRFISSPGESREAVEVARELLIAAHSGVPFDRMAVLVRAVDNYRAVLEEALTRANIPAHFAAGVRRPTPEGRGFALLLACALHGLSARRFAEYLSLGVTPRERSAERGDASEHSVSGPRQWERLLVEAAVSGGRVRWQKRLQGLAQRWQAELSVTSDDKQSARHEALERQLRALADLTRFALPLLEVLEA